MFDTTCMIALILIGAFIFMRFLAVSQLPFTFTESLAGLAVTPLVILAVIFLFYIILGCFIEPLTLIAFSLIILFPLILTLGFDQIWFGVILMLLIGIGMLLPSARVNLRLAQAINLRHPIRGIMTGVVPFIFLMVIILCLVVVFPALALYLPGLM